MSSRRSPEARPRDTLVMAGGVAVGIVLALLEPGGLSTLADQVWAAWAIAACTSAGVVWALGARRWAALPADARNVRRALTSWPAALLGCAVLVMVVWIAHDLITGGNWVGPAITLVAYLGIAPTAGLLDALRHDPADHGNPAGTRLARLIDDRRAVRGAVAGAGAEIALLTIALGAHLNRTDPTSGWDLRVLGAGIAGTVAVAMVVAPTTAALDRRGRGLADRLYPLDGLERADDIASTLARRKELDLATGADLGLFGELQRAVIVLTPLIAGATSAWIGS
ncbi:MULTISPECIES: hypothetical protein [unclassified Isoptericola]|uniref:hypothetical protein n=1 Tax=unclassified Isoptericola TaxID=2623355 RepID=UPI00365AAB54